MISIAAIQLVCLFTTGAFVMYTICRVFVYEARRSQLVFIPYIVPFFLISLTIGADIVPDLITYFGIPKVLTLGVQIGKFLPGSCEASLPLEGPDGTPCYYKRLKGWTLMYLRAQYGFDHEELRLMWKTKWISLTLWCLVSVGSVLFIKYKFRREQAIEAAKVDQEGGRSECISSASHYLNFTLISRSELVDI